MSRVGQVLSEVCDFWFDGMTVYDGTVGRIHFWLAVDWSLGVYKTNMEYKFAQGQETDTIDDL